MAQSKARKRPLEDVEILTEQWELLAEDAKQLSKRYKSTAPTAQQIETLKQDFSQSLTADAKEIDKWLKGRILKTYPRARLEWIEEFHMLVGESDDLSQEGPSFCVPQSVEHYSWWQWYAAIRGMPPADFPSHLPWRVCLHRYYLTIR